MGAEGLVLSEVLGCPRAVDYNRASHPHEIRFVNIVEMDNRSA
jgi:hypothetical protein